VIAPAQYLTHVADAYLRVQDKAFTLRGVRIVFDSRHGQANPSKVTFRVVRSKGGDNEHTMCAELAVAPQGVLLLVSKDSGELPRTLFNLPIAAADTNPVDVAILIATCLGARHA